jgi:hypothetical protein
MGRGRDMWSAGAYIHDKSDGAMGKHLVRCQLSRSFFPVRGLESKPEHHRKEAEQQKWEHSISMSALEFLFFFVGIK